MKILFINKYDYYGGAAIIAYKLSHLLEKNFHADIFFAVGNKHLDKDNIYALRKNKLEINIERGVNFLFSTFGLQYFYFPLSTKRLLKFIEDVKPDIINLHNTHGGYFKTSLISSLSKKYNVVWSFHDMWPFTGSAAYTFGEDAWKNMESFKNERSIYPYLGLNTNKFLIRHKKKIYDDSNFTIVTASNWMYENVKKTDLLKNKEVYNIPYGIDLNIYNDRDKAGLKRKFDIPEDEKIILFGAEKLSDPRKGGRELVEVIKKLSGKDGKKRNLFIMGRGGEMDFRSADYKVHQLGYISDENLFADILKASDMLLFPSKDDNLPLLPVNAIACGTPVIAFDVGGCSDIVVDNYNGFLIKPFDTDDFASKIKLLLDDDSLLQKFSKNAAAYAKEKFDENRMASQYYELFEFLNKRR